ncbi:MAG: radical SAM protein [Clostridia bacterium]|nr:radical SAM protein [Clostridia bacterium]
MSKNRTPVYSIHLECDRPPLGLGLIICNMKKNLTKDELERLDFSPGYIVDMEELKKSIVHYGEGIFLFSTYIWNQQSHLEMSKLLRERFEGARILFGGPFIPREKELAVEFLRENPQIDILFHGEGECAVLEAARSLLRGTQDLEIGGITYRKGGSIIHTGSTSVAVLDEIPSPYLMGEFDEFIISNNTQIVSLETSRGCPYHCAFCDWGQSTNQKIREFSLNRIYEELEWVGKNKIPIIELTDSNFGILKRDIEACEYICKVKEKYGFPKEICANFSKNVHENVIKIIKMTKEAGLVSQAILSIQTLNPETLSAIGRKNLNKEHYTKSLKAFKELELPVTVELMLGLPESSVESFKKDLQWACDFNLGVYVHSTLLLPNTEIGTKKFKDRYEMVNASESVRFSDPKFLEQIGLKSIRDNQVVSIASMGEDEFVKMLKLVSVFHIFYGESILKYIMFYLNLEYGISQVEFMFKLQEDDLAKYPLLAKVRDMGDSPASTISFLGDEDVLWDIVYHNRWPQFYSELESYIEEQYEILFDDKLKTVMEIQEFVMGYYGREIPEKRTFKYDFPSYFHGVISQNTVKKLESYCECEIEVHDPLKICSKKVKPDYYEPHHGHIELSSKLNSLRFGFDLNEVSKREG